MLDIFKCDPRTTVGSTEQYATCSRFSVSLSPCTNSTMSCISCKVGVGMVGEGRALSIEKHGNHVSKALKTSPQIEELFHYVAMYVE